MGKKDGVKFGYLVNGCYPRGLKEKGENAFYGVIKVPEDVVPNHFYEELQRTIFTSAGSNIESITTKEDVTVKVGSLLNSRFKDRKSEAWVQLSEPVKSGLLNIRLWSIIEVEEWVKVRAKGLTKPQHRTKIHHQQSGKREEVKDLAARSVYRRCRWDD